MGILTPFLTQRHCFGNPSFNRHLRFFLADPMRQEWRRELKRYVSTTSYALIGILILAALSRLLHLGRESLWFDEAITVAVVHLDWGTFWKVLSHWEANAALYSCLLRLWTNLGESEFVLRSLSALAGVLAVASVYLLGKRMFDTKVALIGAALLATNSFDIQYSQEARSYSLLVLLTALSSLFFLRAIEHSSPNEWAGYILTGTLAVYTHFFGLLVLGAHCASLVLVRPRNTPWRRLLISFLVTGALLVPLAIYVLARGTGQISWVSRVRLRDAYNLFDSFVGRGKLLLLSYFVPCCIASLCALRAWIHSKESFRTWHYAFLLSWLFVPILSGLMISLWKPVLVDKYFIMCLPPLVLLAAVGVSQIRPRWIFVGSLFVLLSLSGRAVLKYYSYIHKEDWREATAYVVFHASPKDGILFCLGPGRFGFDYYVRRLNPAAQTWQIVFPEPYDWTDAWADVNARPSDSMVRTLPKGYERVWLVLSHNELHQQMKAHLIETMQGNYPKMREQDFRGVQVLLYSRIDGHEYH
jgi:4-amino-4-deoxy-L-arabinose transferase-like glycosyltransferase